VRLRSRDTLRLDDRPRTAPEPETADERIRRRGSARRLIPGAVVAVAVVLAEAVRLGHLAWFAYADATPSWVALAAVVVVIAAGVWVYARRKGGRTDA